MSKGLRDRSVMSTKDWVKFFIKCIIPLYNIYWLIRCLIGGEKVNENEHNLTLASLLYGLLLSGVIFLIFGVFAGTLFSSMKHSPAVTTLDTVTTQSQEETMQETQADTGITEDTQDTLSMGSAGTSETTGTVDISGLQGKTDITEFGLTFHSNIPLLEDYRDEHFVSYAQTEGSAYLTVDIYQYSNMSITDLVSSIQNPQENTVYSVPEEGSKCIRAYITNGGYTYEYTVYYGDNCKGEADALVNSIQLQ